MRVTLLENIKALGAEGQIVEVPEGYAIHFLFPQHMAVKETKKAEEESAPKKMTKAEIEEEQLAGEVDGQEIVLSVKEVKGKPKAPVTAKDIKKALKDLGYKVDTDWIRMEPIKEFQTLELAVEFPSGFESLLRVTVEPAA